MKIVSRIKNSKGQQEVTLQTSDNQHSLPIPARSSGPGSSVNGGELLFLALATCYCNDIYREAAKRGITVESVAVEVEGEFGAEGEPARNVTYRARVAARGAENQIRDLMVYTDTVTEIQNTLRTAASVTLVAIEPVPV